MKLSHPLLWLMLCSSILISPGSFAASVSVEWIDPDNYSDIVPTNEAPRKFRKRTFNALERHIAHLARDLPEDYHWSLTVTDLDLAGQVWATNVRGVGLVPGNDMRIINRVDYPRMNFSYELKDEQGNVVKTDEVELVELTFMQAGPNLQRHEPYAYERNMLRAWFQREFREWRNTDSEETLPTP